MIRLKQLITEIKYEYGCLMAMVPPAAATRIMEFGQKIIPDDILYFDPTEPDDYGREREPHVTIKFGLTEHYSKEQIAELLRGTKPFPVSIRGMDIFSNPQYDVIKLNVDGPELHRLREVCDKLPNEDKYPEYHPHMTLAYLRPGLGARFIRKTTSLAKIQITTLAYSDRGNKSRYNLQNENV